MPNSATIKLDVLIFGAGAAGLWLLDDLHRRGYRALLLEAHAMGSGQTVASQGIIHGGLKYTLKGLFTPSADAIKAMPGIWRRCIEGQQPPDLTATKVRSPYVYLWHTRSITSIAGMLGAKSMLAVKPTPLDKRDWPQPLQACAGKVYKLDEQVISPVSFIQSLAQQHEGQILRIDTERGLALETASPGQVQTVRLSDISGGDPMELRPAVVVFTAGQGNAELRQRAGLSPQAMQRRPLHMVMARGELEPFNGHCIDGSRTSVTITSDTDSGGRTVWQIGGQVAEDGVNMTPQQLITHTQAQLAAALGKLDTGACQWATYRVDRAEAATHSGVRPDAAQVLHEGNVITAWPTKLALVPALVERIAALLPSPTPQTPDQPIAADRWPRPGVAPPPWETADQWFDND